MKTRKEYTCPLELTHDIIKGKWKPIILWLLGKKSMSLSELEKGIQGINQKMLIEHLNELVEYGLVDKLSSKGYPLHVEYFLTERGKRMLEAVSIMQSVGMELMAENGREDMGYENEGSDES